MIKNDIQKLALANGFKLKEQADGSMALNPYVYEFAEALLKSQQSSQDAVMENWSVKVDGSYVIVTHKDGSGVVVEDDKKSTIAESILSRLALDLKQSVEASSAHKRSY